MAKIPMGNFGNAMPQVQRIQMPQDQSGNMIAGALQNISQVADQTAQRRDQQQRQAEVNAKNLTLYNDHIAEQEAKVKLDDVLTTEMSEQVTLLKNDVSNGNTKAQDANANLQKWSQDRYKQLEAEMPGHAQENLKQYWDSNINQQSPGFLPLQLRADVQKGVVLADRFGEIATRYDRKKGLEYLQSNLSSLNLSQADYQARVYGYETARDDMEIDDRITTAVADKNTAELKTLITDLDSGKYGYTDGPKAQQKKAQALSRIDAIDKQVEVEENKRVTAAGKILNEFKSQVFTGRALDDAYTANVDTALKGTEHEAEGAFLKKQSGRFQSFALESTSKQLALINQQEANMKNSTTNDAVTEKQILDVYKNIYQEKLKRGQDNPNQLVREIGLQVNELNAIELKSDSKSWSEKAVDNGIKQLALKDANIKLKPISAEDLPEAKKAFEDMGVNQKLNFIGNMIDQSKGVANGHAIWGATLGQLGGGDQSYIMAGIARMNGYKSTSGEDVATAIISGNQALKNKQLIMPKDELLKQKFSEYVGNTASGNTANMTFAGFKSIYAHIAERDNYQHKDKDDINKDITTTALGLATGGVYDQSVKYGSQSNKWKVSKPYGMADENFEDRLESGYRSISKGTGIPTAELQTLRLRRSDKRSPAGEIQYDLINERGIPLQVDGVAWRINMNGATK